MPPMARTHLHHMRLFLKCIHLSARISLISPIATPTKISVRGECIHKINVDITKLCKESRLKEALDILYIVDRRGIQVDSETYTSLLQVCTDMKALSEGKRVHNHIRESGFDQNIFLSTKLVNMYVICNSLVDARLVFDKIPTRNVFCWNAILRGYIRNGLCEDTLSLYYQMLREGIQPDRYTFPYALKACTGLSSLQEGRKIHDSVIASGFESHNVVASALIDMYTKCGSMNYARQVFDKMSERDIVTWSAMIAGSAQNGCCDEALKLFRQMQLVGLKPDPVTIASVLPACARLVALQHGKEIHDYIIRSGFDYDIFVRNSLIDMYTKCENTDDARHVFDNMSVRDVVSWSSIIAGYSQNGHFVETLELFWQMILAGVKPNSVTFASVLPACAGLTNIKQGKEIHNYIIRSGFESDVFVGSALVAMYAKCGILDDARQAFDNMSQKDLVSWNVMIASYAQNGLCDDSLQLFRQMELTGVKPDSATVVSVLPACAGLVALQQGKEIHAYVIKHRIESDVVVGNAVVAMYAKCESMNDARLVFDKMIQRDVVSWNTIIAGYAQNGYCEEALKLFHQMQLAKVKPDCLTIVSVLQVCGRAADLQQGKEVHEYIVRSRFDSDIFVRNGLIDMYAKYDSIDDARRLFDMMVERDVVSWNAMIVGYVQNGHFDQALKLFCQMGLTGMKPDSVTIVSLLCSCARLATMQQGKEIHAYINRNGFQLNIFVVNALIDMYAKCGSLYHARQLFDKMCQRDAVSWTAMIVGYGMHGHGEEALSLFHQMQQAGMKADHITLIAVLVACSHAGLVDEGWQYFNRMRQDFSITPRLEHYACMVDILGRSGHLDEAHDFIKKMPLEPNVGVWGALLGACRIHSNVELGERVAEHLFQIAPDHTGYYVLLSNIYAAAARWDGVAKVRTMIKDRGLKKNPGCSWIEVENRVHSFLVGDRSHPQSEKIFKMLESLDGLMKEAGYVPDTNFVLHHMELEE